MTASREPPPPARTRAAIDEKSIQYIRSDMNASGGSV
jgi:hypothetical protein